MSPLDASRAEVASGPNIRGRRFLDKFGGHVFGAFAGIGAVRVELLAGDLEEAERTLRRDSEALGVLGERCFRPLMGAPRARHLTRTARCRRPPI